MTISGDLLIALQSTVSYCASLETVRKRGEFSRLPKFPMQVCQSYENNPL